MQHSEHNSKDPNQKSAAKKQNSQNQDDGVDAGGCIVDIIKTFGTVFGSGIIVSILLYYTTGYSNIFIGMIGSMLTLGIGFAVMRGYIIVTVVPKIIWYIITLRFMKIFEIDNEYAESKDPDANAGRKLGWAFLVSGILVYGIMSLFVNKGNHTTLIYLAFGLAHGGLYYWAFASKFFRLSQWE